MKNDVRLKRVTTIFTILWKEKAAGIKILSGRFFDVSKKSDLLAIRSRIRYNIEELYIRYHKQNREA